MHAGFELSCKSVCTHRDRVNSSVVNTVRSIESGAIVLPRLQVQSQNEYNLMCNHCWCPQSQIGRVRYHPCRAVCCSPALFRAPGCLERVWYHFFVTVSFGKLCHLTSEKLELSELYRCLIANRKVCHSERSGRIRALFGTDEGKITVIPPCNCSCLHMSKSWMWEG